MAFKAKILLVLLRMPGSGADEKATASVRSANAFGSVPDD